MLLLFDVPYHVQGQIGAEKQIDQADQDNKDDKENIGVAEIDDIIQTEVDVDSDYKDGQANGHQLGQEAVGELAHDLLVACEGDSGNDGEGKHEGHQAVQQIIHSAQILDVLVKRDHECGQNGDCSKNTLSLNFPQITNDNLQDLPCKQDPLPFLPLQIEESLHGELSRVGARHGGGLQVTDVITLL